MTSEILDLFAALLSNTMITPFCSRIRLLGSIARWLCRRTDPFAFPVGTSPREFLTQQSL